MFELPKEDDCPECGHRWHGLPCMQQTVSYSAELGGITRKCECKSAFRYHESGLDAATQT